jgi:hypothetical protein
MRLLLACPVTGMVLAARHSQGGITEGAML